MHFKDNSLHPHTLQMHSKWFFPQQSTWLTIWKPFDTEALVLNIAQLPLQNVVCNHASKHVKDEDFIIT